MNKKKLVVFLAGVMAVCGSAGIISACSGQYDYKAGDSIVDEKEITYIVGSNGDVTQEYTGKYITVKYLVGNSAYITLSGEKPEEMTLDGYAGDVKTLSLKEVEEKVKVGGKAISITSVKAGAFAGCETLENADLSKKNKSLSFEVGDGAFAGCVSLKSVTLPKELYVDDNAVGEYAFRGCENLTDIDMGDRFTAVGTGAFMSCASLESMTLPQKMKIIPDRLFDSCIKLNSVTYPERLRSIGDAAFRNTAVTNSLSEVTSLRYLGASAFEGTKVKNASLPASISYIGNRAFYNCAELESVTIPFIGNTVNRSQPNFFKSVFGADETEHKRTITLNVTGTASIPAYAFAGSEDLYSVNIQFGGSGTYNVYDKDGVSFEPENVIVNRNISDGAFEGCTGLYILSLPSAVTGIGARAFANCTKIDSVSIPEQVTKIGDNAFEGCLSLSKITVPAKVISLGAAAFKDCVKLNSFTVESYDYSYLNTNGLETTGSLGSLGKYFETVPEALETVTLNGVKNIANSALNGFKSVKTVNINFVEQAANAVIGERAFADCKNLETLNAEGAQKVAVISARAFENCSRLPYSQVEAFEKITSLGTRAYAGCDAFDVVTLPATLTDVAVGGYLNSEIFYNCKNIKQLNIEKYTSGEKSVGSVARLFGSDNFDKHYSVADVQNDFYGVPNSLVTVTVKGVQSLSDFAFNGMRTLSYVSVEFDEQFKGAYSLGNRAFASCTLLTTIDFNITENVTYFNNSFAGCRMLQKLDLPVAVDRRDSVLDGLTGLKEITVDISAAFNGSAEVATLFGLRNNIDLELNGYSLEKVNLINSQGKSFRIPAHLFRDASNITQVNFTTEKRAQDGTVETYGVNAIGENAFTGSGVLLDMTTANITFGGVAYCYNNWIVYTNTKITDKNYNQSPFIRVSINTVGIAEEVLDAVEKLYYEGTAGQFEAVFTAETENNYAVYYFSANEPESYGPHWKNTQSGSQTDIITEYTYESRAYTLYFQGERTTVNPEGALTKANLPSSLRGDGYIWYDNAEFTGERITFPYYSKTKTTLYARFEDYLIVEGDYTFVEKDGKLISNNQGKNDTVAEYIIYINDDINVSFDYSVSCENRNDATIYDNMTVSVETYSAGTYRPMALAGLTSPITGQQSSRLSIQCHSGYRIVIRYIKDSSDNSPYPGNDCGYISNLIIGNTRIV